MRALESSREGNGHCRFGSCVARMSIRFREKEMGIAESVSTLAPGTALRQPYFFYPPSPPSLHARTHTHTRARAHKQAYLYLTMEAMIDAGVHMGFPR